MKLPFEFFMALRYLQPKRTFVSAITMISVVGVTLGVMVLIVVISIMSGFERELRDKILGMNAHLTIANGGIIREPSEVFKIVGTEPGVTASAPFVMGPVLIEYLSRISTPYMKGIDPEAEKDVSKLQRFIVAGSFELDDDSVLVGTELAAQLGLEVGDKIVVYSPRNITSMIQNKDNPGQSQEMYLPTELMVSGIFHSGMFEYDLGFIFVNLYTAQRLYNLEGGVHGITLMTEDPLDATRVKDSINSKLTPPIQARTWMDMNSRYFEAIAMEKTMIFFLLTFIILVAGFGITSTLITVIVQKTHEIGLLKALGAGARQIMLVFVLQSFIVGMIGTGLGLGLGILIVQFRNAVRDFLSAVLHIQIFSKEVYQFDYIPAVTRTQDVVLICATSIFICLIAGLIPAIRAARMEPIRALRQNY